MCPRVTMTTYACGGSSVLRDPGWNVVDNDLIGLRESFAIGELLAVVDHVDAEAHLVRQPREMEADMAGADDVQLGRRLDRLDIDVHLSAADEPGLLGEIVRELVVDQLRAAAEDRFARLPEASFS